MLNKTQKIGEVRWSINRDLRNRILERMRELNLSKQALADETLILKSRINEWSNGRVTLSDEEFTRLMVVLDLAE
jgi:ribosome-binding protein aMBF1 (putative translation factor)